ncbi:hypothetical protein ACN6LA_006581, partial [Streptomyces sp. SAS_269]|uniref:hypothetical protein n=1 Tax=Streptomyces sp. SAS_269 TaxID=3412749 RepID=UPI00403C92D5
WTQGGDGDDGRAGAGLSAPTRPRQMGGAAQLARRTNRVDSSVRVPSGRSPSRVVRPVPARSGLEPLGGC